MLRMNPSSRSAYSRAWSAAGPLLARDVGLHPLLGGHEVLAERDQHVVGTLDGLPGRPADAVVRGEGQSAGLARVRRPLGVQDLHAADRVDRCVDHADVRGLRGHGLDDVGVHPAHPRQQLLALVAAPAVVVEVRLALDRAEHQQRRLVRAPVAFLEPLAHHLADLGRGEDRRHRAQLRGGGRLHQHRRVDRDEQHAALLQEPLAGLPVAVAVVRPGGRIQPAAGIVEQLQPDPGPADAGVEQQLEPERLLRAAQRAGGELAGQQRPVELATVLGDPLLGGRAVRPQRHGRALQQPLAVAQQRGDQRGLADPGRADQPDPEDQLPVVGHFASSPEGRDRVTSGHVTVGGRSRSLPIVATSASRARTTRATRAFAASISPNTPGQISSRYERASRLNSRSESPDRIIVSSSCSAAACSTSAGVTPSRSSNAFFVRYAACSAICTTKA